MPPTSATARLRVRCLAVAVAGVLLTLGMPTASQGATTTVVIEDNQFTPQEIRIEPGDTVVWRNQGARVHDVMSDERGQFRSGDMEPGDTFSHTFGAEGYYFYHCSYHGAGGRVGMWGVVIVGNPPPPKDLIEEKDARKKLHVPDDFPTIQKAVNAAQPGSTIVVAPGVYREAVVIQTNDLIIRGVDRFRTVLHGQDKKTNGIVADGVKNVTIKNLTVRNFTGNGIFFNDVVGYAAKRIDSIKNRTYGIYAFDSYEGVIKNSFGYGSGDSAFYIGQCLQCSALVERIKSAKNYLGYSGTNATGVVIRDSIFERNGVGVAPNTLPTEELAPNRGTIMVNNIVRNNNYTKIPPSGFSETVGIPFGTGIWFAGILNSVARTNTITNHDRYGILMTPSIEPNSLPSDNRVWRNTISGSGMYDLAFDGGGESNCFSKNTFETSGPPEIETLYGCPNRPFANAAYGPVLADVTAQLTNSQTREWEEPAEPKRPKCQRGAPGCHRH